MRRATMLTALLLQTSLMSGYAHAQRSINASTDRLERYERQLDRANPGAATSANRSAPTSQILRAKRDRPRSGSEQDRIGQPIR